MPLLMVGGPVPCCLGRANGEKVKYEAIMEFSKRRCEDEQDAMKPTEVLYGEDLYLTGQSSAGVTLASATLVVEFSTCCRDREDTPDSFIPDAQRYILWFVVPEVPGIPCEVSTSSCGVFGGCCVFFIEVGFGEFVWFVLVFLFLWIFCLFFGFLDWFF